ncbi:MAG TPA: 2-amino-4-hydroxy-6-hydroxymethyldihydropteridine diphosphokinase [Pirellulaceae bacterium]
MPRVLLGIGSNLGDRQSHFQAAVDALKRDDRWRLESISRPVPSRPVGGPPGQADFLNAAAVLVTDLAPEVMVRALLDLETRLGRIRTERWAARSIDLDVLLYDDLRVTHRSVAIPHPWMAVRSFVLRPAAEIAADWVHPELGLAIGTLWSYLRSAQGAVGVLWVGGRRGARWQAAVRRTALESGWSILEAFPDLDFLEPNDRTGSGADHGLESRTSWERQAVILSATEPKHTRGLRAWIVIEPSRHRTKAVPAKGTGFAEELLIRYPRPLLRLFATADGKWERELQAGLQCITCVSE